MKSRFTEEEWGYVKSGKFIKRACWLVIMFLAIGEVLSLVHQPTVRFIGTTILVIGIGLGAGLLQHYYMVYRKENKRDEEN